MGGIVSLTRRFRRGAASGRIGAGWGHRRPARGVRTGVVVALGAVAALSAACGSGVIVPGAAVPTTVAIPQGSQIGTGTVPVSCNVPVLGKMTFIAKGTGAVGTVIGPGQQFSITDASGDLEVPGFFFTLAAVVGAKTVDAQINTLNIDANGASPGAINMASSPIDVTGIPVVPGQSQVVDAPMAGQPKFTIGPFTAPQSGPVSISIGNVSVTITLINAKGQPTFIPLTVTCQAPNPPIVLVGFTVDPSAPSSPASTITGVDAPPFTVPVGDVEGSLSVPIQCSLSGIGAATLDGTMTGQLPAVLPTGDPFAIEAATGHLNIPGSAVTQLMSAYPGATQAGGTISTLDINATNASPSSLNVAATPIDVPDQPLTSGQTLSIALPASGTLTVGPFTAGSSGTYTRLTWGDAAGTITLADSSGQPVGTVQVSCQPPAGPVTLLYEPITPGPVPTVTGVSPASGPVSGGTTITITGSGFASTQAVNVGNGQATWSVNSTGTQITATTPPGAGDGPVDVTVLGPDGPSLQSSADQFTYTG